MLAAHKDPTKTRSGDWSQLALNLTLAENPPVMIYRTYVPDPPLREYIAWFWFYKDFVPNHTKERIMPHGGMELVIDLGAGPKRLYDRENYERFHTYQRSWISGVHSEFIVIEAAANSSMMGVRFRPGGAYPLFGFPMTELRGAVVHLEQLFGTPVTDLRDSLLEAPDPLDKFRLLERFLLQYARKPWQQTQSIRHVLAKLSSTPEVGNVQGLAESLGMSHKHFIQEFSKNVGVTPKRFCRIRRFQGTLARIQKRQAVSWAEVACSCGYFDQAHFIKEFSAFSGLNPSAYMVDFAGDVDYVPVRDSG